MRRIAANLTHQRFGRLTVRCRSHKIMSHMTYTDYLPKSGKILLWLKGEVKTPPFSSAARVEAGGLLRRLQRGESIALPHSRPMPGIGPSCHELRVPDATRTWRIVYSLDADAVVILEGFSKAFRKTPKTIIDTCVERLKQYRKIVQRKE